MRKPVVDYRRFRFGRLNTPEFSHLWLLLGWVGYFALYFITENLIPPQKCHVIHWWLDDLIPFCEWFLIPYVFWYLLIVISLGYFLLYHVDSFKRLQTYIIITQVVAMTVYILYPSMQDLRPAEFVNDNLLTQGVAFLYSFDTNTGVLPSLHVAYSLGIASVWLKEKGVWLWWKIFVVVAVILICLSTMFIKQHSALDVLWALPLGLLAEGIVYRDRWKAGLLKLKKA
ncbi:MAG: phosphatase PAP2 family protein [Clostridia bacterium]|nr:phosphatase PAP2 family protein [Clostridia bacterium]